MFMSLLKTLLLYFFVILTLRGMGKRQVGELETSELVVTILVSELAAIPMQDPGIPLIAGVAPILCLMCLEVLLSGLTLRFVPLRRLLSGKPSRLMHGGHIDQRELFRQRLSVEELCAELRILGYPDIADVQELTLETNGKLSLIPKPGRSPGGSGPCVALINGARPDREGMRELSVSREELEEMVRRAGCDGVGSVLYLYADAAGRVHCIPREEK